MSEQELPFIVDTPIPEGILVQCPLYQFRYRHATHCTDCPELHGVLQICLEGLWEKQFRIACRHPVARQLHTVVDE